MQLRTLCLLSAAVVIVGQTVPAHAQGRMRETTQDGERAVCMLQPVGKSGVSGTIYFEQSSNRIHVTGKISGLAPGKHGFHVHQYGDLSDLAKGESAGGHWNPRNMQHGAPDARTRHVGDLGNVDANAEGVAIVDEFDTMLRFRGSSSILGRSIIVHEKADTFIQPTGGAGGRVAIGIIGWAKPPATK